MPKYNNEFRSPEFREEVICQIGGGVIGTIRIKPSSVMWKPKGAHTFYTVDVDTFVDWIKDPDTNAKRTKS